MPPSAAEMRSLDSHPALAETASRLFYWAAVETDQDSSLGGASRG